MVGADENQRLWTHEVASSFSLAADVVIAPGDCLKTLRTLPDGFAKLIITSPPYNIGKAYEKATALDQYLSSLRPAIEQIIRVLSPEGSLCWQVGNYVEDGEVFPLDIYFYQLFKAQGLKLRNRIIWHFEHGLHASRQFSGNPLGKNPSDIWRIVVQDRETALWNIPNVKANHPEKTVHPCQFPIELVERGVLALTNERDWVVDQFSGVGSALL